MTVNLGAVYINAMKDELSKLASGKSTTNEQLNTAADKAAKEEAKRKAAAEQKELENKYLFGKK